MNGIAISGKAGAGKSAFARQLAETLGVPCKIMSYAGPLKTMCEAEWGITKDMVGGREALERYGDEKRAEHGEDYFIRLLDLTITGLIAKGVFPIIDDLRLADEYDHLTQLGFFRLRVVAPMSVRWDRVVARGDDPAIVTSQSRFEVELDQHDFDCKVFNVGSLSDVVAEFVSAYVSPLALPSAA
jgi:hypothetical protein